VCAAAAVPPELGVDLGLDFVAGLEAGFLGESVDDALAGRLDIDDGDAAERAAVGRLTAARRVEVGLLESYVGARDVRHCRCETGGVRCRGRERVRHD